jgi:fumarylacetoacetate (FAA) hydrolase family protein
MLCTAGADVNVQDLVGRSPVWLAVAKDGRVTHLRSLLQTKLCELNCPDLREKRTALQVSSVTANTFSRTD